MDILDSKRSTNKCKSAVDSLLELLPFDDDSDHLFLLIILKSI